MMRELRSSIIQNLQIDDKLIGTNFDGLDIYINGITSVSKIINLRNSGVIRVLQTFGLIYSTERVT